MKETNNIKKIYKQTKNEQTHKSVLNIIKICKEKLKGNCVL